MADQLGQLEARQFINVGETLVPFATGTNPDVLGEIFVSYSDHYEEKGVFQRLMDRLRKIMPRGSGYAPVMLPALR